MEWLDQRGVTKRDGDVRFPRDVATTPSRAVTSAVTATSTHPPSGSDAIPIAARACLPASPSTATRSSLAPFAT